jgi:predicted RNase H-like nuclease (RuvC/YqgF family)
MALTESQRNRIAQLQIRIQSIRKDIENLSRRKKSISERYAGLISSASDANQKRNYRQYKISETNTVVNDILRKKKDIENLKNEIASIKNR